MRTCIVVGIILVALCLTFVIALAEDDVTMIQRKYDAGRGDSYTTDSAADAVLNRGSGLALPTYGRSGGSRVGTASRFSYWRH